MASLDRNDNIRIIRGSSLTQRRHSSGKDKVGTQEYVHHPQINKRTRGGRKSRESFRRKITIPENSDLLNGPFT